MGEGNPEEGDYGYRMRRLQALNELKKHHQKTLDGLNEPPSKPKNRYYLPLILFAILMVIYYLFTQIA